MTPEDTQRALRFGPEGRLLGLLDHRAGDADVACLMMNVGVTQHIGPRRLNVKLARALAAVGITSLRLDLSGIGDSGAAAATDRYRSQALADLRAAMDRVQAETGIRRFAVLGICSGAVNAYRLALEDERVVGAMMFDGYAFPDWKTRWVHDWRRATSLRPAAVVQRLLRRVRRALGLPVVDTPSSIFFATRDASAPTREEFAAGLDAITARGARLLIAYSGSLLSLYNHESQMRTAFAGRAFLAHSTVRYLPHLDHIPTSQAAQREFLAMVVDWVRTTCTRSSAPAAPAAAALQT